MQVTTVTHSMGESVDYCPYWDLLNKSSGNAIRDAKNKAPPCFLLNKEGAQRGL